jgi:hypothetical protein
MGRRLAAPAALLLALGLVLTGARPAGLTPLGARAAPANEFVVLVDGLCSTLEVGQAVGASFLGEGGLYDRLLSAGWPADSIVPYSYRGGSVGGDGRWQPKPYACEDSRDQNLAADAGFFAAQLGAIGAAHPGAVFHLVGTSLGGVVVFTELVRLATLDGWVIPGGARLGAVVTLDSPIGGVPFVDEVCGFAPDECGGSPIPAPNSALRDMSTIWDSGSGHPAGGKRSIAAVLPNPSASVSLSPVAPRRNQELAFGAVQDHGVRVLTIGNVRDWLFAPFGPKEGPYQFLDTQWLTSDAVGSGLYARAIDSGAAVCPGSGGTIVASYSCNHGLVTRDPAVGKAIVDVIGGGSPAVAATCPAGRGGCLSLPPRPAVVVSSAIAAGVITSGGRFVTSSVKVAKGTRATIVFGLTPALANARVEIWARSQTGTYHRLTSRLANAVGSVRYFTPPVTAWTAYQARYAGDFVHGPGVSPGRVVIPR